MHSGYYIVRKEKGSEYEIGENKRRNFFKKIPNEVAQLAGINDTHTYLFIIQLFLPYFLVHLGQSGVIKKNV